MKQLHWIALGLFSLISATQAEVCSRWEAPKEIGRLDSRFLPEASGLAISQKISNRAYHVNDKGNEPLIYVTDLKGAIQQKVSIPGLSADSDTEELGYGKCGSDTCVFVGDIGDNDGARASVQLLWFKEQDSYATAPTFHRLKLTYPDGAHNAEGFFIHPNGDAYLFTKESGKKNGVRAKGEKAAPPLTIFKIPAAMIMAGTGSYKMEKAGEIDTAFLLPDAKKKKQIVTGAAVAPNGKSFTLLTNVAAIEVSWDFRAPLAPTKTWREGTDYSLIPLTLPQPEALDYYADASGLLITSEGKDEDAPVVEIRCR